MLLMPRNVGKLADLASPDNGKYSLSAVRVDSLGADRYRVVATDGQMLGLVEGPGECWELYPQMPALSAAPNGATTALVPASAWTEAFKLAPSLTGEAAGSEADPLEPGGGAGSCRDDVRRD
jgi:hypothetical protein